MFAKDIGEVREHYKRIAPVYRLFNLVFALPPDARRRAVDALRLAPNGRVLEVGVGTGRNLKLLVAAVGPAGFVCGVDATPEMLAVARRECRAGGWLNVELRCGDAMDCELWDSLDGVLFSLSYSVMPRPQEVLKRVWRLLRPGGRLVILDGSDPQGPLGTLVRALAVPISRLTVLGDPSVDAEKDLLALTDGVIKERLALGTYSLCSAAKPR